MRRWFTTSAAVLLFSAALRADITIVQTTTVEGGMAQMAAASGASMTPRVTMRVKGMKMRSDVESGPISMVTIVDVANKQVIILRADQKTATIVSTKPPAATTTTTTTTTTTAGTPPPTPGMDASVKPTGRSQVIDGVKCDEYLVNATADMSTMRNAQMPPEAAAMMQGMKVRLNGSIWVAKDAPGAAEYMAFQKAAAAEQLAGASAVGVNMPGMENFAKAMGSISGLPYLTEMETSIEGSGQMADMMKQMGTTKVTTKVSSINADPLSDDLFKIPEGYTTIKQ
jgi:hypothetical protein